MRDMMALVLYLGGVGKCMSLIWGWSVHHQESGDLQAAPAERINLNHVLERHHVWDGPGSVVFCSLDARRVRCMR